MMIRVIIKNGDDPLAPRKLLKFDASIDFECLLRKIAAKVGAENCGSVPPSEFYELSLGGDTVVEATSDLDYGDKLVLRRKPVNGNTGTDSGDNAAQVTPSSKSKCSGRNLETENQESGEGKKVKTEDVVDSSDKSKAGEDEPVRFAGNPGARVQPRPARLRTHPGARQPPGSSRALARCSGGDGQRAGRASRKIFP